MPASVVSGRRESSSLVYGTVSRRRGSQARSVTLGKRRRESIQHTGKCPRRLVSDEMFFSVLAHRHELGMDFLREMDTLICTNKSVMLPLDLCTVAPGRCVSLSPFGHSSNMGFQCAVCSQTDKTAVSRPTGLGGDALKANNELCSVALAFYNHADKIVQHKTFYLSLLSHSMDVVRLSFLQPGLLYAHLVLRAFGHEPLPIFVTSNNMLTLFLLFKTRELHLGETTLRLLMDNLPNYKVSMDCVKQNYVMRFTPVHRDTETITVPVHAICEAVTALDCTDELRDEIQKGTALANSM
ncbi:nuclear egress lamina protein [Colobine gammaherpesvirus 1]|uniref:Nuclear egress lamina protein n=1 Tax=Colobine gammaherpesvirus 1 TaxID=2597325 RepID=A0A5B8G475_9GAMA|nr:nuclear egress lamina protein [Colobine gammaherpesvirus 1]QDQ69281.1 nuclear egress lamina protein [Colobine gammaherpesvirus 1]